jgi:hypothetical protein
MTSVRRITALDFALLLIGIWLLSRGVRILRRRAKTTPLKGPASKSLVFGNSRFLSTQKDAALVYEEWAEQYGAVYRVPTGFGGTKMILCDPKAIQHFYSKETYGYNQNSMSRILIVHLVCLSPTCCEIEAEVYDRSERECFGQKEIVTRGGYTYRLLP